MRVDNASYGRSAAAKARKARKAAKQAAQATSNGTASPVA